MSDEKVGRVEFIPLWSSGPHVCSYPTCSAKEQPRACPEPDRECHDRNHIGLRRVIAGARLPDASLGQDAALIAQMLACAEGADREAIYLEEACKRSRICTTCDSCYVAVCLKCSREAIVRELAAKQETAGWSCKEHGLLDAGSVFLDRPRRYHSVGLSLMCEARIIRLIVAPEEVPDGE